MFVGYGELLTNAAAGTFQCLAEQLAGEATGAVYLNHHLRYLVPDHKLADLYHLAASNFVALVELGQIAEQLLADMPVQMPA